jgi:hypothetical protein
LATTLASRHLNPNRLNPLLSQSFSLVMAGVSLSGIASTTNQNRSGRICSGMVIPPGQGGPGTLAPGHQPQGPVEAEAVGLRKQLLMTPRKRRPGRNAQPGPAWLLHKTEPRHDSPLSHLTPTSDLSRS